MLDKNGPVGPFLHDKSGPGRTTFVDVGPFLTNKTGPSRTGFHGQKRSAEPILCGTIFAVTDQYRYRRPGIFRRENIASVDFRLAFYRRYNHSTIYINLIHF